MVQRAEVGSKVMTRWARRGLLVVLLPLGACSSTAFEDPDDALRRELRRLSGQVVELQKQSVVSEVEILRLREKVAELTAKWLTWEQQCKNAPK